MVDLWILNTICFPRLTLLGHGIPTSYNVIFYLLQFIFALFSKDLLLFLLVINLSIVDIKGLLDLYSKMKIFLFPNFLEEIV